METHSLLEILEKPWSAASHTPAQQQRKADVARAKELWDEVLQDFRAQKDEFIRDLRGEENDTDNQEDTSDVEQPFRFLDLPTEIRNRIYDFSIHDDAVMRQSRVRSRDPSPRRARRRFVGLGGFGSRSCYVMEWYRVRARKRQAIEPTEEQKHKENELHKLLNKLSRQHLQKAEKEHGLSNGFREAFDMHRREHDMYTS